MTSATDLNYIHTFVPAPSDSSRPVTLLLLHGTGGDENSLLSLGNDLWPGAALLGLRGKVLENGMPPSFRRFTEVGGAILFRVMVPLVPEIIRDFRELSIFIGAARLDPLIPAGQAEELAAIFKNGGANVAISWHQGGRELGEDDVQAAKSWFARYGFGKGLAA